MRKNEHVFVRACVRTFVIQESLAQKLAGRMEDFKKKNFEE